jgi:hypothetical protein
MSCGCKKNNQSFQSKPSNGVQVKTQQQQNSESVKNAVTKIVEKYYMKK